MTALYDKLRPKTLDEVVGFKKQINRLNTIKRTTGWEGQVFWITGGSGNGKTTIARIIAQSVSEDWTITEIDAQDVSMDMVRGWEMECQRPPLGNKPCYAYIINEAHGLSSKVVSRLQTTLEAKGVQTRGTFVFTTTYKGQQMLFDNRFDSVPFMSRAICIDLELDGETVMAMARYLQQVALSMNLDGKPIDCYTQLVADHRANLRSALQHIATGAMAE